MIALSHPLVLALLAFLSGLLPALRFAPPPFPFLIAVPLACLATAVASSFRSRFWNRTTAPLLLIAFAAAGAGSGAVAAKDARGDCRWRLDENGSLRLRGRLGAAALSRSDGSSPLLPVVDARVTTSGECRGEVRVRLPAEVPYMRAGTGVELTGKWIPFDPPVTGGAWPRDPVFSGFVVVDSLLRSTPPVFRTHPLLHVRGIVDERLSRLFPRHEAIAEALLLGRRERLDPALRDRFARAGLAHLLAISGAHVGLLAGGLLLLGSVARLPRRRLAAFTLGMLALYLMVIGAPASAMRAGLMFGLALLALVLQRPSALAPMIAATALLLLSVQPLSVLNIGFQLSFAGVLGIVVARRYLQGAPYTSLERRLPLLRAGAVAVVVSAAAFVATAPIVAHHFGQLAPISILASLPAVPLLALALTGVAAALVTSLVSPPLARLVADGTGGVLDLLDRLATIASTIPHGHFPVTRPDWGLWMIAGGAGVLALTWGRHLRLRFRVPVGVATAAAVLLAWPTLSPRGSEMEVHFLDVGQGDAVAVRTPAGRWLLIDTGPRGPRFDAGERRILPFLRAHGARRLEAMVLTHPDLDHIGGATTLLRQIPIGQVVEPGHPAGKESYLEVLREVEARGIPWSVARSGRTLVLDGVRLEFLWPDDAALDAVSEANQISAVAMLRYGGFSLLLTGDAPDDVERELAARQGPALRAQVLKAGHHGSTTSTSPEFLKAVRPELVVISAGRRNRYGHPAPEVLARLRAFGIEIARTDQQGTISLRASADPAGRWRRDEP